MALYHDCKTPFRHPKGRGEILQKKVSIGTYEIENAEPKITIQRVRQEDTWVLMCAGMTRTEYQKSHHIEWLAEVKRGHAKSPVEIIFH